MKKSIHKNHHVRLSIVVVILLLAVVIHSCKKEISPAVTNTENKSNPDLIADAKTFFDKQVNITQSSLQANGVGSIGKTLREQLAKQALFTNAYTQQMAIGTVVIVPLNFEAKELYLKRNNRILKASSLTNLLIYSDNQKIKHAEVVTRIPDDSYLADTTKNKLFTGIVTVEDWQGSFLKAFKYSKGAIVQNLGAPESSNTATTATNSIKKVNDFYCYTITWYQSYTVDKSIKINDCCTILSSETYCYSTVSGGGGGVDGNSGGGSTGEPNYGNVGGGTTDANGCPIVPPPSTPYNQSVTNKTVNVITSDPCSSTIINDESIIDSATVLGDDAMIATDCNSFTFIQTSGANWQEAGVKNIRLKWVWLGNGMSRELYVPQVVFGLPIQYTNRNGSITTRSAGWAAVTSARYTELAKVLTYQEFKNSPYTPDDATVIKYFREQLQILMATQRGTAGINGTGNSNIIFNDEDRSSFFPYSCDQ